MNSPSPTSWGDLIALSQRERYSPPPASLPENRITLRKGVLNPEKLVNDSSHDYLAQRFAVLAQGRLLYTPETGWLHWDKHLWRRDTEGRAIEVLRSMIRTEADALKSTFPDYAQWLTRRRMMLSRQTITSTLALAQSEPAFAANVVDFDADRYAINTPAGLVDLVTGEQHAPDSSTLVMKSTTVAPDFDAETPLFDRFMAETFAGDEDLSRYVLTGFGLSLIGAQDEQVFFLLYGVGGAGKGTLMQIIQGILGTDACGYSISVEASTFMAGRKEGHPTEIARLVGARMVVGSEITEAAKFDTARLKNLVGGDSLTGRFMGKDFFTFPSTWTLWLMTNYRPRVSADDTGFWRRLREVPFRHKAERAVGGLAEHIVTEEGPGILAKAVRAAADYLQNGITVPESVVEAAEANRVEQDSVTRFLDECVESVPDGFTTVSAMREAYEQWCSANKYDALGTKDFGDRVHLRYSRGKKSNVRGYTSADLTGSVRTLSQW